MPPRLGLRPTLRVAALLVLLALAVSAVVVEPAGAAPAPPTYRPPVDAPVVDPFRLPASRYGPGNRGLEYGTTPGTPVLAPADGTVTFAGLVAGSRHVTVLHADGLRTTVSYLATIDVVVGQRVRQGHRLGTTGGPLHLSARNGDAYLDPASLFAEGPPQVRLVPFDLPPGIGLAGERSAIRQLLGFGAKAWGAAADAAGRVVGLTDDALAWLQDASPELLRAALHYAGQTVPVVSTLLTVITAVQVLKVAWDHSHRPCTDPDVAPPAPTGRRVAIEVAGLGSTSDTGAIGHVDTDGLGYDEGDVVRFSYAGGPTEATGGSLPGVTASSYGAGDTQQDLHISGRRLADLVEDVAAQAPGVPIDLLAHSQGGLVARLALIELQERHGDGWLERVGLLATLGTPHGGADLATALSAINATPLGNLAFDGLEAVAGLDTEADGTDIGQMSETSDLIRELADHPLPPGLRALSVAARGDLLVPVPRTHLAGATEVVVPVDGISAHDSLPGSPEANRELALALAGLPPTCTSFAAALLAQVEGVAVSTVEDLVGAYLWSVASRPLGPLATLAPLVDPR